MTKYIGYSARSLAKRLFVETSLSICTTAHGRISDLEPSCLVMQFSCQHRYHGYHWPKSIPIFAFNTVSCALCGGGCLNLICVSLYDGFLLTIVSKHFQSNTTAVGSRSAIASACHPPTQDEIVAIYAVLSLSGMEFGKLLFWVANVASLEKPGYVQN